MDCLNSVWPLFCWANRRKRQIVSRSCRPNMSIKKLHTFEDSLVDVIKMIHAVKLALRKRHEKRLTYSTCLQEVETKQMQLAKLRAQ
jgi:hypothetical protein